MVVVDTSIWIPFFNRPASREKLVLDALIDADQALLVGVVLTEILQGCRTSRERDLLTDLLRALPYLEVSQSVWVLAGDLSADLQRRGVALPLSDLLIGAMALIHKCRVYTLDAHFKKIPGLGLFTPTDS